MQRIPCPERDDWRETAARCGFDFYELDGERYWDERAYYAFTIAEIELGIEEPTAELEQMCLALVARVVGDEALLRRLKIPQAVWPLLAESWRRRDGSLYGRFDLSYQGGRTPAKLLEYNADTPTSIFEAAVFQWTWLEQAIERRILPGRADQYNSIHERLIERWRALGKRRRVHLAGLTANAEDATTLAYLADTAAQAGLSTTILDVADIGWRESGGGFVDLEDGDIALAFKLYPWEWMIRDAFGVKLAQAPTQWIEPPWKAILSNKGILPLLWQMHEGHPNLLPAYFEDDPKAAGLGPSFVRKPIYSREGANVSLVSDGVAVSTQEGPYGAEGFIRQAPAPLPDFGGVFPVIGSWLVDHQPCGLSIREDTSPITGNRSRFLPHAIL
ncbi:MULTISPECIES: glutathionylspermidine synthase family protein [unclassified Bradyrhizobium]|uniref:glutathionylspermidine synthase family protein n=1 Tax=unclassified Bradyrhizobium TaxID=2631580 RepID=UPI0028F01A2A|nr:MULTISPECIES: glutathionylspermidine synthase family protein [unclassified Bradyrhizobium]